MKKPDVKTAYLKVILCYDSVKTLNQFNSADKLLDNFIQMFPNESSRILELTHYSLNSLLLMKT